MLLLHIIQLRVCIFVSRVGVCDVTVGWAGGDDGDDQWMLTLVLCVLIIFKEPLICLLSLNVLSW